MSFNMRKAMLKQLTLYRAYVRNSEGLYWKYHSIIKALHPKWLADYHHPNYRMWLYSSVFHDTLYLDVHNALYDQIEYKWERGCHHIMQGSGLIQVHIYADAYDIVFNLDAATFNVNAAK